MPAQDKDPQSVPVSKARRVRSLRPARIQGIDQIWLINLDRRKDRLERFMHNHPEMFGRINRLPAYDGRNLQLTPALARLFAPNNFDWHKPTMGCAMSHLALWSRLAGEASGNTTYLILEDDALLEPAWVHSVETAFRTDAVPHDWEIIYLGGVLPKHREHFEKQVEPAGRPVKRVRPDCVFGANPPGYFHFCAYAYLLNRKGALRLLDLVQRGNGVWLQADFLAAYTTPQLVPPRPIYFFHPLIAQSYQDAAQGMVRPYDDDENLVGRIDSDIWQQEDNFSQSDVQRASSTKRDLDIAGALGLSSVSGGSDGRSNAAVSAVGRQQRTSAAVKADLPVHRLNDLKSPFEGRHRPAHAIALCADRKFFPYASVAILSLLENAGCDDVPIFFFAERFEDTDLEKFKRLSSAHPGRLHLVELGSDELGDLPSVRHMSRATYARLWLPEALRKFQRILYLDSDVLVLSSLREMLNSDLRGQCAAAVRDLVGGKTCKIDFFRSGAKPYFNAGVLLIDTDCWNRHEISAKVLELAKNTTERERLSAYADQCLLNYVIRGDFAKLDAVFNWLAFEPKHCSPGLLQLAPTPTRADFERIKILHFVGENKPWMPSSSLHEIWSLYEAVARRSPWHDEIVSSKNPTRNAGQVVTPSSARTSADNASKLPTQRWDYVSPNFVRVFPDEAFPQMVIGDVARCGWPYLRRQIPHNWYIDRRTHYIGFATRDEAAILFNTALDFTGQKCLEIGCWMGWSAAHILMAGVELDIIDPVFANPVNAESIRNSLAWVAQRSVAKPKAIAHAGMSPAKLAEVAAMTGKKWALAFIDGDHEGDGPLRDAQECERHLEESAMVLFHDLTSPFVAKGLDHFRDRGWNTKIYNTMQIMGVAWRGNVVPVEHQPDPKIDWHIPDHLAGYDVSSFSFAADDAEFERIYRIVKPFTMVGRERLLSLYRNAVEICRLNLPGDFVECGACRGGSAALLAYVAKTHSMIPRTLYACDTFEGMPEPGATDRHQGIPAAECGFPAGSLRAPIETGLMEVARRLGVADRVTPVKGLFRDTLPPLAAKIGPVALLHADGDWYESTMDIFRNLFEKIPVGGYVQIDDYGHWEGCRKAVQDYQRQKRVAFNLKQIDDTGFGFRKS